jgi:hypothetical protein
VPFRARAPDGSIIALRIEEVSENGALRMKRSVHDVGKAWTQLTRSAGQADSFDGTNRRLAKPSQNPVYLWILQGPYLW